MRPEMRYPKLPRKFFALVKYLVVATVLARCQSKLILPIHVTLDPGTKVLAGPCSAVPLSLQNISESEQQSPVTLLFSGTGSGNFYASFHDCQFNIPSPMISLAAGVRDSTVYFKDYLPEALTVNVFWNSKQVGESNVQVVSQIFHSGSGFDANAKLPAFDATNGAYYVGDFSSFNGSPATRIARLSWDGVLDAGFQTGTGFNVSASTAVVTDDGSGDVYVGGNFTQYNGVTVNHIVRLRPDGSINSAFNQGAGFDGNIQKILLADDGSHRLYVLGGFTHYDGNAVNSLLALNPDGSIDASFNTGTGFTGGLICMALSVDGSHRLYVGGGFSAYQGVGAIRIIRLKPDGSRDPTFVMGSGFNTQVNGLAVTRSSDNDPEQLYVVGSFTSYQGSPAVRAARLQNNGTLDSSFDTSVGVTGGSPNNVAVTDDGSNRLYLAGPFSTYNGTVVNGIVRLQSGGAIDPTFNTGTGLGVGNSNIAIYGDGSNRVYFNGTFTNYRGVTTGSAIRLLPDGTLN